MIKEMDDVVNFMTMHPKATMLTEETLALSAKVNVGKQCACNLTAWLNDTVEA